MILHCLWNFKTIILNMYFSSRMLELKWIHGVLSLWFFSSHNAECLIVQFVYLCKFCLWIHPCSIASLLDVGQVILPCWMIPFLSHEPFLQDCMYSCEFNIITYSWEFIWVFWLLVQVCYITHFSRLCPLNLVSVYLERDPNLAIFVLV